MGPAQAVILPQNLWDIIRVKNIIGSKIEVVFQRGTHNVESAAMVAQTVRSEEDMGSIAPIP